MFERLEEMLRRKNQRFICIDTPAEESGYIALNPETGTTSQGETVEEAIDTFGRSNWMLHFWLPFLTNE